MKNLASALLFRVGARGAAALLQAVTLILIARDLGPPGFGVFGQAQSIGIIGAAVFSFGFSSRALRLSIDSDSDRIVSGMFVVRAATASLVALLVVTVFYTINSDSLTVLFAVGSLLFSDMLNDLTQGVLSGLERQRLASAFLILHRVFPFLAVVLQPFPGLGLLAHFAVGCWLAALAAVAYPIARWAPPIGFKKLTAGARGFWLSTMAGPLIQLDTTVIRLTSSVTLVGYYSAAARVGAPINLIASSLVNIVVPAMTKEKDEQRRINMFLRLRRMGLVLAAIIIASSPLVAELIVRLLGEAYRPGWAVFCGIIVGAAFSGISQMYQAFFLAVNLPRVTAICVGLGTIVGLLILGVGSAVWGIVGLAVGPPALQLTILILFIVSFKRVRRTG